MLARFLALMSSYLSACLPYLFILLIFVGSVKIEL